MHSSKPVIRDKMRTIDQIFAGEHIEEMISPDPIIRNDTKEIFRLTDGLFAW